VERVTSLREQAELLRGLARSSDVPAIRDELLAMAADCERVAQMVAEHLSAALSSRLQPPAARG
jgi:hypothetical protein